MCRAQKTFKTIVMEKKERQFDEQDHPLKNTDQAFVQVGKDGEPVIPKEEKKDEDHLRDRVTTIEHR